MNATDTANRPYGKVLNGHTIPYGTLADASFELRQAYYGYGVRNDEDWPALPVWEPEPQEMDLEDAVFFTELPAAVRNIFEEHLRPRELKVLCMRFGIDCEEMTLEEVGNLFDLTRERIRQIEAKAIRKLRHPYRCPEMQALRGLLFEC